MSTNTQLEKIRANLVNCTPWQSIVNYLPGYVNAPGSDDPHKDYSLSDRLDCIEKAFTGEIESSVLETIHLTFLIEGILLEDITYLHYNKAFSFSRNDHDRFFYASCNLKDLIYFIKYSINCNIAHIDSDVILAYQMYLNLCHAYPVAHLNLVDFDMYNREDVNESTFEKLLFMFNSDLEKMKKMSKEYLDEHKSSLFIEKMQMQQLQQLQQMQQSHDKPKTGKLTLLGE